MKSSQNNLRIGMIGLGVMGKNLALNLLDHQYSVAGFDRDEQKVSLFNAQIEKENLSSSAVACTNIEQFFKRLRLPRIIILSVPAGDIVDQVCQQLIEQGLRPTDIVVDTGNSLWSDSQERAERYSGKFLFYTSAVSGGEVGARFGPSLMASGSEQAWQTLSPIFEAIAAKVDDQGNAIENFTPGKIIDSGSPCAAHIGPAGSGHYVKMVHNGIEYADMQLICEAYHYLRVAANLTPAAIADIFDQWNHGPLNSYLMGISAEVLRQQDPETGLPLVDVILDKAGQKGTGLWTAVSSLQLGAPATTIAQAVFARAISAQKSLRLKTAKLLTGPTPRDVIDINALHNALYCAKICVYAQGFELMRLAAKEQQWSLNFAEIARIWRAGCIIRARFLQSISSAYERNPECEHLLLDDFFSDTVASLQGDWRKGVLAGIESGVPMPCFTAALSYYDSLRCETLPANLLQGQRDFFGAHTFLRNDKSPDEIYHMEWSDPERPLVKL